MIVLDDVMQELKGNWVRWSVDRKTLMDTLDDNEFIKRVKYVSGNENKEVWVVYER